MVRIVCLLLCSFGFSSAAFGGDHLEPENGMFSEEGSLHYYLGVRDALLRGRIRTVQMVTLQSFEPERAIFILKEKEYGLPVAVSVAVADDTIWNAMMERIQKDSKDPKAIRIDGDAMKNAIAKLKIKVTENSAEISQEVADLLSRVWDVALKNIHHSSKQPYEKDGTSFYFATWVQGEGMFGGKTGTPPKGSRMAKLVSLSDQLRKYTETKQIEDRRKLETAIKAEAQTLLKLLTKE